jgi:hypothetical protein
MKMLALLAFAAGIVACDQTPTAPARLVATTPRAAVIVNDHSEYVSGSFNYCDGSVVTVAFKFHEVIALTFDGAGGGHFKDHFNVQGQGSDAATGVDYVSNDVGNIEDNYKFGEELTYTEHYNLIAKGNAPNADLFTDFHITITPNGDVTSFHDAFRVRCQ